MDLDLERGDFVVVTGEVGAGKTTLLRCLVGLLPPDAGELRWNETAIADPATFMVPPRAAFTAQAPRLFSESLADNIRMGRATSDEALAGAVRLAQLDADVATLAGWPRRDGRLARRHPLRRPAAARRGGPDAGRAAPSSWCFDDISSGLDVATEQRLWEGLATAASPSSPSRTAAPRWAGPPK